MVIVRVTLRDHSVHFRNEITEARISRISPFNMVHRCCVPQCTSKAGDVDIYGTKVRFHRMPQSPDRFLRWCLQISDNRKYKTVLTSCSRVCSKHFRKEDYMTKKPFGNNPLKISAEPCIFKWNSACFEDVEGDDSSSNNNDDAQDDCKADSSGTSLEYDLELRIHREIQCSLMDKKIVEEEIGRKNSVIEQLLGKISSLEEEQRSMEANLEELRAANSYYDTKIRELQAQNLALEQRLLSRMRNGARKQEESYDEDEGAPVYKKSKSSEEVNA